MLVGGVIDDQLGDDSQAACVRGVEEPHEVVAGAVVGVDALVVGDVVAVVAQRRFADRQQPQARHAKALQVIELPGQPGEIADAVAVAVAEGLDVQLVDDRVLVPEWIGTHRAALNCSSR